MEKIILIHTVGSSIDASVLHLYNKTTNNCGLDPEVGPGIHYTTITSTI